MEESVVREHAQAFCDAILAGDIDSAIASLSTELHRNLGEVIALLPLPAKATSIDSIEAGGPGYNVVLQLVGEDETVQIQTRWKDREGVPTIVEVSHLSKVVTEPEIAAAEGDADTPA